MKNHHFKEKLLLLVLSVLLMLSLVACSRGNDTPPTVPISIENITVQDGVLSWELVNDNDRVIEMDATPNFEKKVGEEWQAVVWRDSLLAVERKTILQPHSRTTRTLDLRNVLDQSYAPGVYRILFGDLGIDSSAYDEATGKGVFYHVYPTDGSYIFAEFSIS